MPNNVQLLKQVLNAATVINRTTDNPEHKALLAGIEVTLHELMRQDKADFYLQYIARGRVLINEGMQLLTRVGKTVHDDSVTLRNDLNAETKSDVLDEEINRLHKHLVPIIDLLDEGSSAAEKTFFIKVSEWQASLALHRLEQPEASRQEPQMPITAEALSEYLQKKFPHWTELKLTKFVSLDGGFSKKTILFETYDSLNGPQSMVVRAEQPVNLLAFEGSDVGKEFYSIQLMQKAGLPIAEPLWLEQDRSFLGTRFLVSRKAAGRGYGGNMGSNEMLSTEMIDSIFSWLVKMHGITLNKSDSLLGKSHFDEWQPFKTIEESTRYYVTDYIDKLIARSDIDVTPQILRGVKWLRANVPESDEPAVIVHTDYALNNLLFDEHGVSAILDWESSRLGDPADDIIWTQLNLADYLSMPEFLKRYKAATGRDVSEFRLAYARVAKCVLNFIVFQRSLEAIDKFDATNINLCILGIKYPGYFVSQFTSLIDAAENAKK